MTNKVSVKAAMKELAYRIMMVNFFGSKQITDSHGLVLHFDNGAERKLNDGLSNTTLQIWRVVQPRNAAFNP